MKSLGVQEYKFWQPISIFPVKPQNKLERLGVKLGEIADNYVSLYSMEISCSLGKGSGGHDICVIGREPTHLNVQLKALKVISFVLALPLFVTAFVVKAIYKETYVKPFLASLEKMDFSELMKALNPEQKRRIITELPEWYENHLKNRREISGFTVENLGSIQDSALDKTLEALIDKFAGCLRGNYDRNGIMLRGLTLSEDPLLASFTDQIIYHAWLNVCEHIDAGTYAWCNRDVITKDSYEILERVLKTQTPEVQQKVAELHSAVKIYPRLIMGETHTIYVVAPSIL